MNRLLGLKIRPLVGTLAFAFAVIALQFSGVQSAHAASTAVWTGAGSDNKFSTAANWSGSTLPITGDTIQFNPLTTGTNNESINLVNDLSNVSFAGVIQNSNSTNGYFSKDYFINTITLANNASYTKTGTGNNTAYVDFGTNSQAGTGTVTGLGNVTIGANTYFNAKVIIAGNLTAIGAVHTAAGSSVNGNIIITSGATIPDSIGGTITVVNSTDSGAYIVGSSRTLTNNFTFGNSQNGSALNFGYCTAESTSMSGSADQGVVCDTYGAATYVLSGDITLTADATINVAQQSTVQLSGTINYNGHTLTKNVDATGSLQIGSTVVEVPAITTPINDSAPNQSVVVANRETTTLDGTRGSVVVNNGGTLKGTGTANELQVNNGGIVAPGHSPGTLTVLTQYNQSGEYQAEIQTKDAYDQLVVSDPSRTTGNDVTLGASSTLTTIFFDGYSINTGDTFKIIDNKSGTLVSGTFQGLAEGAHFTVSNVTFSISYIGGDGNDIVLTALTSGSAPSAPNTAVKAFILANPIVTLIAGLSAAAVLILATRKQFRRR